jgi:protocatechuate 3,4-dioxygenase beta subunit
MFSPMHLLFLLLSLQATPSPKTANDAGSTVSGTVVNSLTGEPLRKANVTLMRASSGGPPRPGSDGQMAWSATADASGAFTFTQVEPGRYRISAERNGFVAARDTSLVEVKAQQPTASVQVKMQPQGVVTGRILDEDGEPMARIEVTLMRNQYVQGRKMLVPAGGSNTNDLGEYRIFGVNPGRYFLLARRNRTAPGFGPGGFGPGGRGPGGRGGRASVEAESIYVPIYFPGVTDTASAAQLEIGAGSQLQGMDLRMRKVAAVTVSGRVVMPELPPAPAEKDSDPAERFRRGGPRSFVMISPRGDLGNAGASNASVDGEGKFEIVSVTPGSYILIAQGTMGNDQRYSARMNLEVGPGGVEGLVLTPAPPVEVTGSVKTEGNETADFSRVNVYLSAKEPGSLLPGGFGRADKDGNFTLRDTQAGVAYRVIVSGLPAGWYLKSAQLGDQSVLEPGLTLVSGAPASLRLLISSAGGAVSGTVNHDDGQPVKAGVTVILWPKSASDRTDITQTAFTDSQGKFSFKGVAPGDYRLAAVEPFESGAHHDPDFLKPLEASSESVSVKERGSESKTLKLKLL